MHTIQTQRLFLSPLQLNDAAAMYAYASDPEVAQYTSWSPHESVEASLAFLNYIIAKENWTPSQFRVVWGIKETRNGPIIGTVSFGQDSPKSGHLDYALSRTYWGKGYTTEAVERILDWVFEYLPRLEKVCSGCLTKNKGSVRVLEKAGFKLVDRYSSKREGKFGGALLETCLFELNRR
ncbi:MAG: hypothetical protein Sapg2KO_30240 [Saprospiraceae bacterium]